MNIIIYKALSDREQPITVYLDVQTAKMFRDMLSNSVFDDFINNEEVDYAEMHKKTGYIETLDRYIKEVEAGDFSRDYEKLPEIPIS